MKEKENDGTAMRTTQHKQKCVYENIRVTITIFIRNNHRIPHGIKYGALKQAYNIFRLVRILISKYSFWCQNRSYKKK